MLDTVDVLGDPIKRTDYYGKPGAPTTILEEPTTDTRIRQSSQISGVSVSNVLLACTEVMASVAFKHTQKCQEDTVQKVEAAKTEAEGLAKGIPTQRGSITRSIGIGNPPTCSREWRLHSHSKGLPRTVIR